MARKLKSTPFARFLVAMLFIVPLAYIGAAYYNGEDPIQLIKEKLGMDKNTTTVEQMDTDRPDEEVYDLRAEVEQLKQRLKDLELENAELKEKVRQLELNQ